MTNIQFYKFWGEALEYTDRSAFVSDAALSSLWGEDDADPMVRVPELEKLWDAAHTGVKAIRELACMTQAEFAARHLVPLRTLQRWEKGECPEHIRLFLLESEGVYRR